MPQPQNQDQQDYQDYLDYQNYQKSQSQPQRPGFLEQTARNTVNDLPVMGGIVGGIAGTPADVVSGPMGNVVGAGVGGYLGTAAKNAINKYMGWEGSDAPKNMTQVMAQPVVGGATQAALQGTGELAAPYIAKGISKLSNPASEMLEDVANEKAIEATGATGKQASNFEPGAGRELLKKGIVKPGNSQAQIAAKATSALEKSAGDISSTLSDLDARGAIVDQADVINKLRQRAEALGEDPAQFNVSDSLNRLADRLQTVLESKGGNTTIPLSKAEATKRGFQQAANYNSSPLDLSISKEAANIYRQAVEDAATKFDSSAAKTFASAKKTYGLLAPIEEATTRRAMTLAQSPKGGLLDAAATGVGAAVGGAPGAIIAAPARRIMADRIAPTLAGLADLGSNAAAAAPGAAQAITPAAAQIGAQYGLMAPGPSPQPQIPNYSTIPGKNGY